MVKEILRSKKPANAAAAAADLPPISAADREYLFFQLLEGVTHGWQQPRVNKFFAKIKHRSPKSQWLDWLTEFGDRLLADPNSNEDLARKMIQLSELDCGEVTSLAGDYGNQLLGKIYGGYTEEILPELVGSGIELGYLPDLGMGEMDLVAMDLDFNTADPLAAPIADAFLPDPANLQPPVDSPENSSESRPQSISPDLANALNATQVGTNFDIPSPFQSNTPATQNDLPSAEPNWDTDENNLPTFGEVPEELRLSNKRPAPPPPPPSTMSGNLALDDTIEQIGEGEIEERQISIEEFDLMLRNDPELVQQIAQQLGLETTDPQVVFDRVVAQMQEQIPDSSQP
jgi:hypothetical protein